MSNITDKRRASLDLLDAPAVDAPGKRILRFRASSNNVARDRGIIDPAGWQTDEYERSHPVFLWSHNPEVPPLGKAVHVERRADGLVIDVEFMDDPFSDLIYRNYLFGSLRAVSAGFRVLEERTPTKEEAARGATWCASRCLLLELSAVTVPADVSAVLLGARREEAARTFTKKDVAMMRSQFGAIQGWEPILDSLDAVVTAEASAPQAPKHQAVPVAPPATETRADGDHAVYVEVRDLLLRILERVEELQPHEETPRSESSSEERKAPQEASAPPVVEAVDAKASPAASDGRTAEILRLLKKHYPNA